MQSPRRQCKFRRDMRSIANGWKRHKCRRCSRCKQTTPRRSTRPWSRRSRLWLQPESRFRHYTWCRMTGRACRCRFQPDRTSSSCRLRASTCPPRKPSIRRDLRSSSSIRSDMWSTMRRRSESRCPRSTRCSSRCPRDCSSPHRTWCNRTTRPRSTCPQRSPSRTSFQTASTCLPHTVDSWRQRTTCSLRDSSCTTSRRWRSRCPHRTQCRWWLLEESSSCSGISCTR